jgi:tetratricopeptide (TPR) repeat protein
MPKRYAATPNEPSMKSGVMSFALVHALWLTPQVDAGGPSRYVSPTADTAGQAIHAVHDDSNIGRLIEELGSPDYAVRRRAEGMLVRLGVAAFDALMAAEDHVDVEIASQAAYLIQRVEIDWVEDGDTEEVRRLMAGYEEADQDDRLRRILGLGSLAGDQGILTLCRIARYEQSPILSKVAARTLLQLDGGANRSVAAAWTKDGSRMATVASALGSGSRPAVEWIRNAILAVRDPQAAADRWRVLADEEQRMLAEHPERSRGTLVVSLLGWRAALLKELGQRDQAVAVMLEMVELDREGTRSLEELLEWLAQVKDHRALDEVVARFSARIHGDAVLLYALAASRSLQGDVALAEQLAAEAFRLGGDSPEKHYDAADRLEQRGLVRWAEREYRQAIGAGPATSRVALWASNRLSLMLFDQSRQRDAAVVLKEAVEQIDRVLAERGLTPRSTGAGQQRVRDSLRARMEYYFAMHFAQQEQWPSCREHLERAIEFDPLDADVLIAMRQIPNVDEEYREKTERLIEAAAERFRQDIRDDPTDAQAHNQLAWLIANTTGDFDEALRASQESLRLEPGLAGFLDTLAHCHHARGDHARAVEIQTRAVKLEPHTRAIAHKLEVFRRALEDSQRRADGSP